MIRTPRRTTRPAALLVAALLAGMGAACSYDPHPADGKLGCSSPGDECPQGYTCDLASATCFSNSTTPGAVGSGGTSGNPGTGGATISANASDYVGTWAFDAAGTVVTSCNDGSADTVLPLSDPANPADMTIVQDPKGLAPLQSTWLCDLLLNLDSAGAHLGPGSHACMVTRKTSDPPSAPQSRTWTANQFELTVTKRDRNTASHVAEYTRVDVYSATHIVTCLQDLQGDLQKL